MSIGVYITTLQLDGANDFTSVSGTCHGVSRYVVKGEGSRQVATTDTHGPGRAWMYSSTWALGPTVLVRLYLVSVVVLKMICATCYTDNTFMKKRSRTFRLSSTPYANMMVG